MAFGGKVEKQWKSRIKTIRKKGYGDGHACAGP